jgi:hypothetical protein
MGGGEGDKGNGILETDIDVGNGEYVDEDTEEGILAGDVCMGDVDADFDAASLLLFLEDPLMDFISQYIHFLSAWGTLC